MPTLRDYRLDQYTSHDEMMINFRFDRRAHARYFSKGEVRSLHRADVSSEEIASRDFNLGQKYTFGKHEGMCRCDRFGIPVKPHFYFGSCWLGEGVIE